MPIYEYQCNDCHTKFEMLRPRNKADDPPVCKKCQGTRTSRAISRFAAHSDGQVVAGNSGGCAGCSPSASCATCRSH
jgi:putative FmdB family regulatory protein